MIIIPNDSDKLVVSPSEAWTIRDELTKAFVELDTVTEGYYFDAEVIKQISPNLWELYKTLEEVLK